jgi:predicted enzyme related to lactoylglutathione lyase
MSSESQALGRIGWIDLTVPDATKLRDFYRDVVGWTTSDVQMDEYSDYCMHPPDGGAAPVAGVCHARGPNSGLPPVWLVYLTVKDLDASLAQCRALGGKVRVEPKSAGGGSRFAVIEDPAGAVSALFQSG